MAQPGMNRQPHLFLGAAGLPNLSLHLQLLLQGLQLHLGVGDMVKQASLAATHPVCPPGPC